MEFIIGGLAAVSAACFTNPLEVVKTRLQLQGELKAKGQYTVHYRNFFHAFYIIGKTDGLLALQKGLAPSLIHQVLLNGTRLGIYQFAEEKKWHLKDNGDVSLANTIAIASTAGAIGAYTGSPLYLVKVHLQSRSTSSIAVGHQHAHEGTLHALRSIYQQGGVLGMWRGAGGAVPRLAVGSASQLGAYYVFKEYLEETQLISNDKKSLLNTTVASFMGGLAAGIFMTPFDVISTRLYNQGVDSQGRGLLYSGYFDCVRKVLAKEGFFGLYKGFVPCFARIGPHTVLCLVFWDLLKDAQKVIVEKLQDSRDIDSV